MPAERKRITAYYKRVIEDAKALSQPAQVYAQKRDPKAAEYFRKAMSKMIPGSSNYKITQSYLLHDLTDTYQK
ncbi:MAG: hypothetical protein E7307_12675 [Butyrivibrio sp.]|nr:hypothetical protein [Butyrivibrio sp.]